MRASTGIPRAAGLDADRLEAEAVDARAAAGRDEQAVAAQPVPSANVEHVVVVRRARASAACWPKCSSMPSARQRLGRAPRRAARGSRASRWSAPSTSATSRAHAARRPGQLDADRAAAEDEQPPRDLLQPGGLAVRPDAVELAQAGDRRDHGVGAGRDHDVARRCRSRRRPARGPGRRAARCRGWTSMPALCAPREPGRRRRSRRP